MRKYQIRLICMLFITVLLFKNEIVVNAQSNFNSYTYDEWNESMAAPASYRPIAVKNGFQIGSGAWNTPQDFFMDEDGHLYVADTGNNRIVVLDHELN